MSLANLADCCDEDDAEGAAEAPQLPPEGSQELLLLIAISNRLAAVEEQLAAQNAFMVSVAAMVEQAAPVMDALAQGGMGGIFKLLKG